MLFLVIQKNNPACKNLEWQWVIFLTHQTLAGKFTQSNPKAKMM